MTEAAVRCGSKETTKIAPSYAKHLLNHGVYLIVDARGGEHLLTDQIASGATIEIPQPVNFKFVPEYAEAIELLVAGLEPLCAISWHGWVEKVREFIPRAKGRRSEVQDLDGGKK